MDKRVVPAILDTRRVGATMAGLEMRWKCPSHLRHGLLPDCNRTAVSDRFARVIPEFDGSESPWFLGMNRSMSLATGTIAFGLEAHAAMECAGGGVQEED